MAAIFGFTLGACGGGTSTNTIRQGEPDGPRVEAGKTADGGQGGEASGGGPVDAAACEGDSVFADPSVEAAVRASLGQPTGPLAAEDLARVTQLNVPGASSLEGVQCLEALVGLVAPDGNLIDLSPLRGLQSLASVLVERSHVSDLAPLSNLPSLRSIHASDNAITSLAGLSLRQARCNYVLNVQRNPLSARDVEPFCALGWLVTWGGSDGAPAEQCNLACL